MLCLFFLLEFCFLISALRAGATRHQNSNKKNFHCTVAGMHDSSLSVWMEVHCFRTFNDVICRSNPTFEEYPEFVPIKVMRIFFGSRGLSFGFFEDRDGEMR